jgi:hypothetical protein
VTAAVVSAAAAGRKLATLRAELDVADFRLKRPAEEFEAEQRTLAIHAGPTVLLQSKRHPEKKLLLLLSVLAVDSSVPSKHWLG